LFQDLEDFVIVEPEHHNSSTNGASILRRSADFSKMLLEFDYSYVRGVKYDTQDYLSCLVLKLKTHAFKLK
jgi:hypothetical protein